ncbi:hypothetical protein P280DRAFT_23981 [Massarina eburnea CBS 473.64]|uniref:Uncharacterized protein n=1 Tax=Massarina eburnea CBS 473.64 TaxID=1395130 RepID=A0A6A6RXQ9_9PLEO|nr:hypothetical protein P280DRAFT_23981 [Massarina eburnea CBS 473.64]
MEFPNGCSVNSSDSMQKYLSLSSEKEMLRRRLSLNTPGLVSAAHPSPEFRSMASSPTHSRSTFTNPWSPDPSYTTTASNPIPAQPGTGHRYSITDAEDAHKLAEVNQEIKCTLTELLNTDTCRADGKYRQYIQGRLMDAEHEIRQQRRRRSSSSNEDREFASSIAEHLDLGLQTSRTWG